MLSILESTLLIDFLGQDNLVNDGDGFSNFGGRFSPPSEAIWNAVKTPSLNFSEAFNSADYDRHQINAKTGFNPEESIHTEKFKIEDD